MDEKTQKRLQKELKVPCHISYIAERVFKLSLQETQSIINDMIEKGMVEESCFAKNYYKIKQNV